MEKRRESNEILKDIKVYNPWFKKEDMLEFVKWDITNLYNLIKNSSEGINCREEVLEKIIKDKKRFRITNDIDHISVQYVELYDYIRKDNKDYIKIYVSAYFYDNVDNNIIMDLMNDKYFNDIWIVTYMNNQVEINEDCKCNACGATMKHDNRQNILKCEYCGNTEYFTRDNGNWELVDIEVRK